MPAIAGLRGTGDWASEERPKSYREQILWRNPNGTAPILALSSKARKEQVADPEFKWWDEAMDLVRLTTDGTTTTAATTIYVDSPDPSSSAPGIVYGTALNLKPGDQLMVEPTADAASFTPEFVEVVSVTDATTIVVTRGVGGSTAAQYADARALLLMSNAYAEGTGAPTASTRNPVLFNNYCQIFKDVYDITGTAAAVSNLRTGDPIANDKKRKMFDHSRAIELSIMFGKKNEATSASNGKPIRRTGGLREFIPLSNTTVFGTTPTVDTFFDAVRPVFDFDTGAGDERIAFCGNLALNFLNKMVRSDSSTTMELGNTVKTFGMNLRTLTLPQGTLYLRGHPLLNRHAMYSKSMFIIDFSALRWRYTKGRDTKFMDNIQNNDEDRRKGQWFTEGGLEVGYGGLSCGYIGNITA